MRELAQARQRLPAEWRQLELKKLLGAQKSRAAPLIAQWKDAGYIEEIVDRPGYYRFTAAPPLEIQATEPEPAQASRVARPAQPASSEARPAQTQNDQRADWRQQLDSLLARLQLDDLATRKRILTLYVAPALVLLVLLVLGWQLLGPSSTSTADTATEPRSGAEGTQSGDASDTTGAAVVQLPQAVVAWYAPGGEIFGAIDSGVPYTATARYGSGWLQVEFAERGQFWVRQRELTNVVLGNLTDLRPPISGYFAYIVQPGDSLQTLATATGSDATLIAEHNRLTNPVVPGRPLIVPVLEGGDTTLASAAPLIKEGNRELPYIALTIDIEESDPAALERMLTILRERDVQLTFFAVGSWIEANPDIVRQLLADGHELGSHSYTHADFREIPDDQIVAELTQTEQVVTELTGGSTLPLFRPPYGSYDNRVLQTVANQGYLTIHWSIDSRDAVGEPKSAAFLVSQIAESRPPADLQGQIVLAHCCTRASIVDALPALLDRLAEQGLEVVTVSEVLGS